MLKKKGTFLAHFFGFLWAKNIQKAILALPIGSDYEQSGAKREIG